jgi:cupin 2 domain-containing protein
MNGAFFRNLPDASRDERFETLCQAAGFRIERIVSNGQSSPEGFWYDQDWDEWVMVLRGTATLRLRDPDETLRLAEGDWALLPAHRKHRVESTSQEPPTVWLAVHGHRITS